MTREPTVAVLGLRALVAGLQRSHVDPRPLFAQAGIDPSLIADDEARVPALQALDFAAICVRESHDPDLGLHSAEQASLGAFDVLDYVLTTSESFGEGLHKFARFQRLLTELAPISYVVEEKTARLRRMLPPHPGSRVLGDLFLGLVLVRGRRGTGRDFSPVEAGFQYPRPEHVEEHDRLFRCPLRFDFWNTELVLERAVLDYPMLRADSGLSRVLDRYAAELVARRPPLPSLAHAVREQLAHHMTGNEVSLQAIARHMRMSTRTLQRRLSLEHVSFGQLIEEVRRDLAERYLDHAELTLTEIAFLLGFSDVSSFHRAFKRWTRQTPAQFRGRTKP